MPISGNRKDLRAERLTREVQRIEAKLRAKGLPVARPGSPAKATGGREPQQDPQDDGSSKGEEDLSTYLTLPAPVMKLDLHGREVNGRKPRPPPPPPPPPPPAPLNMAQRLDKLLQAHDPALLPVDTSPPPRTHRSGVTQSHISGPEPSHMLDAGGSSGGAMPLNAEPSQYLGRSASQVDLGGPEVRPHVPSLQHQDTRTLQSLFGGVSSVGGGLGFHVGGNENTDELGALSSARAQLTSSEQRLNAAVAGVQLGTIPLRGPRQEAAARFKDSSEYVTRMFPVHPLSEEEVQEQQARLAQVAAMAAVQATAASRMSMVGMAECQSVSGRAVSMAGMPPPALDVGDMTHLSDGQGSEAWEEGGAGDQHSQGAATSIGRSDVASSFKAGAGLRVYVPRSPHLISPSSFTPATSRAFAVAAEVLALTPSVLPHSTTSPGPRARSPPLVLQPLQPTARSPGRGRRVGSPLPEGPPESWPASTSVWPNAATPAAAEGSAAGAPGRASPAPASCLVQLQGPVVPGPQIFKPRRAMTESTAGGQPVQFSRVFVPKVVSGGGKAPQPEPESLFRLSDTRDEWQVMGAGPEH